MNWYVSVNGQQTGPLDDEAVLAAIRAGQLRGGHISPADRASWAPIHAYPPFAEALRAAALGPPAGGAARHPRRTAWILALAGLGLGLGAAAGCVALLTDSVDDLGRDLAQATFFVGGPLALVLLLAALGSALSTPTSLVGEHVRFQRWPTLEVLFTVVMLMGLGLTVGGLSSRHGLGQVVLGVPITLTFLVALLGTHATTPIAADSRGIHLGFGRLRRWEDLCATQDVVNRYLDGAQPIAGTAVDLEFRTGTVRFSRGRLRNFDACWSFVRRQVARLPSPSIEKPEKVEYWHRR